MPRQDVLTSAKAANKNEFYTQYEDIEKEVNAYVEYNPDVFRDKIVLLPCDDPEWSNFTKYFAANFERFGLKKLISTSYAKGWDNQHQISMFELMSEDYDKDLHDEHGKIFILDRKKNFTGRISHKNLRFKYLQGDGDFRSAEVTKLRDEADFIITNPPFNTLFREFFSWVIESGKQFLFIASINSITYKELFPYIKDNIVWTGTGMGRWISGFIVPGDYELYGTEARIENDGRRIVATNNCLWLTNMDHGKRHEPLQLMTMAENLKYNKTLLKRLRTKFEDDKKYPEYDNYQGIEVPFTEAIPSDYPGIMGVPVSFMDKFNPEQFEIVGITDRQDSYGFRTHKYTVEEFSNANDLNARACVKVNGIPKAIYARILIRHKKGGADK